MELLSYLASVTARSLCLAAIALLGVWLFRVKTAAARHAALTVITGGMLLLAALTATLPSIPLRVLRAERAAPAISPSPDFWVEAAVPMPPLAVRPAAKQSYLSRWLPDFEWPAVASAVYFAGALFLLLRLAYGYLFTRRLVRASRREGDLYESAWISVPMTVGWLRPKILLPAVWKEWEAAKLEAVLAHERTHIQRADWAIAAVAAFNRCVFWFNPLAWWMERKLAFLAEQACDDAAVLATGAREPYAEALLDMAAAVRTGHGRMVWEAMAMARTVEVRKRIERILDETRQIPRGLTRARWTALIACALPLMYVASVAQLAPAQAIPVAPRADYANPSAAAEPQTPQVVLAQTRPASAAPNLAPPRPAQSYAGRRALVLYFDLQGMTTDDQIRVQNAGLKFISSQMTSADKVAVMTNAGGVKVLQDFTDDRDLLSQVVRSITVSGSQNNMPDSGQQLIALESAVRMLTKLPEKKALLYFSSVSQRNVFVDSAQLRTTINAALQANVAFYPVDTTGLVVPFFQSVVTASSQPPYAYIVNIDDFPIQKADPIYPAEAMAAGVEGDVQFRIIFGTDGHVRSAQLISGNPLLVAAAREAVNQYQVRWADGEVNELDTTVTVPFRLNGGPPVQVALEDMRILTRNDQAEHGRNSAGLIGDHAPVLLRKVGPEYPFALRAQNVQGTVTLAVTIGVDGVPRDIHVTQSADPGLDAQAIAAAGRWQFTPARKDGQPVEAPAILRFTFRLQ
jgi:TonB family protein